MSDKPHCNLHPPTRPNYPYAGSTAGGGQTDSIADGGLVSPCVGKEWPTADPAAAGPFKDFAEKKIGPLAGYTPDPIYGDEQQRFNIYRPDNLQDSGYCHPVLAWANGHTDNPEPNSPKCVVDSVANKWCGQYLPLRRRPIPVLGLCEASQLSRLGDFPVIPALALLRT